MRALANGVRVKAWTFDELYGRCGPFLDGLDRLEQAFVGEVPPDFRVWLERPRVARDRATGGKTPRRLVPPRRSSQVRHLRRHSPGFYQQAPQLYRVKDTQQGPEVWEVQWHTCWRRVHGEKLVSRQQTLLVARNVLTDEIKYFLANRVPGQPGWSVRALLRVAFGRWPIEACFREAKEELGFDHYECRGWQCLHRHFTCVILSQLHCAQVRQRFQASQDVLSGDRLTVEQVRRATNVYLQARDLPRRLRRQRYERELEEQRYYQERNALAAAAHQKKRQLRYSALGIDPDAIKSCILNDDDD